MDTFVFQSITITAIAESPWRRPQWKYSNLICIRGDVILRVLVVVTYAHTAHRRHAYIISKTSIHDFGICVTIHTTRHSTALLTETKSQAHTIEQIRQIPLRPMSFVSMRNLYTIGSFRSRKIDLVKAIFCCALALSFCSYYRTDRCWILIRWTAMTLFFRLEAKAYLVDRKNGALSCYKYDCFGNISLIFVVVFDRCKHSNSQLQSIL